jgi:hypothetical protein
MSVNILIKVFSKIYYLFRDVGSFWFVVFITRFQEVVSQKHTKKILFTKILDGIWWNATRIQQMYLRFNRQNN